MTWRAGAPEVTEVRTTLTVDATIPMVVEPVDGSYRARVLGSTTYYYSTRKEVAMRLAALDHATKDFAKSEAEYKIRRG